MRFWLSLLVLITLPLTIGATLSAEGLDAQKEALQQAKLRAQLAERRSEGLRQEASNAARSADRLVAQRAVLSADMDAAAAQIEAAQARIAIITSRQNAQRAQLGQASEPMLRLNGALQQMTGRPTALLVAQPGTRSDYIHLRAVMGAVKPEIARKTALLRQKIAIQRDLKAQEIFALGTLGDARKKLADRRTALAQLVGERLGQADSLSANAAVEFEQAIAQGERARDIVERMDSLRESGEIASGLAALDGPILRSADKPTGYVAGNSAYILPTNARLVFGFNELNNTGYRERGIRLTVDAGSSILAPASGRVNFAGPYRSYGNIVILEHGNGWTSLITNLDTLVIAEGTQVNQGTALGRAGSDEPEITMELRRHGRIMDIMALLL